MGGADACEMHSSHGTLGKGVRIQMPPTPKHIFDSSITWGKDHEWRLRYIPWGGGGSEVTDTPGLVLKAVR